MTNMVQHHIKVAWISPGYDAYLNLEKEMILRASIVDAMLLTEEFLDGLYFSYQCDIFKIDDTLVYQVLLKIFIDVDEYVYMKQRVCMIVKLCTLMYISDFLVLTTWPGRPQMQRVSCRTLTMMVKRNHKIVTKLLHFTRNITL